MDFIFKISELEAKLKNATANLNKLTDLYL